jgi:hypothetical protein
MASVLLKTTTALSLVLVLGMISDAEAGPPSPFGCGRPQAIEGIPEVLVLIDGVVVDTALLDDMPPDSVGFVEIVCAERAKELLGVEVSLGVSSIWRHPSPLTLLERDFDELRVHQDGHFRSHGRYAGDVTSLAGFQPNPRISFDLSASPGGWSATARHNQFNHVCSMSFELGETTDVTPLCESEHRHGS